MPLIKRIPYVFLCPVVALLLLCTSAFAVESESEPWSLSDIDFSTGASCLVFEEVSLTAVGANVDAGEDSLQYKFVWMKDNWVEWGVLQDFSSDASCDWKPSAPGLYKIYIDVKDSAGNRETISRDLKVNNARISCSLPWESAFSVGETPSFAVEIGSASDFMYKFVWMKDNWAEWGVIQDFGSTNTCNWTPSESGEYWIYADVKDGAGKIRSFNARLNLTETWSYDALRTSYSGVILSGETVDCVADVSGNTGALQCKFVWMKDNWAEWGVIQDFGSSNTCEWIPAESGKYALFVDVRDSAGRVKTKQVSVVAEDVALCFAGSQIRPFEKDSVVDLAATSGAGSPYSEYKFVWMKDSWAEWGVIQDFGSSNTCEWIPAESGDYTLFLDARRLDGGEGKTVTISIQLTEEWRLNSFASELEAPQVLQPELTIPLAALTDGNTGALRYKFVWMKDNWAEWGVIQEFGESNSCEWKPGKSGEYTLFVDIKNSAGSVRSISLGYSVVKPWSWTDERLSVANDSQRVGETAQITANVQGDTDALQYKFVWMKGNWAEWGVIREFGSGNTCEWVAPDVGDYEIIVDIRDQNDEIESAAVSYKAWELRGLKLSLSPSFSGSTGYSVTICPDLGCDGLEGCEYKYVWMKDDWAEWGVISDFTDDAEMTWVPTEGPGYYGFFVDVRLPDSTTESTSALKYISHYDPNNGKYSGYSSPTGYLITVDCGDNIVTVYRGSAYNWRVHKIFRCTSGAPSTPTVKGTFFVGGKGLYFDTEGYVRCFYYTQFYGNYLFHSTLYYTNSTDPSKASSFDSRLGMNLSHGCIRLQMLNAKWIYDYIPRSTKVIVFA